MKGEIKSCLGDKVVVSRSPHPDTPSDIEFFRRLIGRNTFVDNKKVGRVFDIIGNIKNPYLIIRLSPKFKKTCSDFLGKKLIIQS